MNGKRNIFLIALLGYVAMMSAVYAGTTGKLRGTITDASSKEPLVSANVVLKGTSLGATSDIDGNYTIINIPPGVYSVSISIIGYRKIQINDVRVDVDLTTNQDASLQQESVELETMVITAERPLIRKDNTGSLSTVSADQIKNLPVQTITDILRLDAGIVQARGELHFRGGRDGEVSYMVDGISATDVYNGSNGVKVENAAVQELQVISGTFNAEYGQAMSGIVNTITKEGEDRYTGQIKLYGGDYASSDSKFSMYKGLTTVQDPTTGGTLISKSDRVYPLKDLNPIYNVEFNVGGPIPLVSALKFFMLGRFFYDEGYYYGVNWYKPNGAPGDSSIVPMNPNKSTSLQGKINYQLSNSLKLSYGGFWNQSQQDRTYFGATIPGGVAFTTHDYLYDPYGLPETHSDGWTQTFTLNHIISPKTFYEFRVTRYFSETEQYKYKDPTQGISYLIKRSDGTTFNPKTYPDSLTLLISQNQTYSYIANPNGPDGYTDPNSLGQPTSYSFVNHGMDPNHFYRSTSYWAGKFDLTSQIDKIQEWKIGAEARFHQLELHSYQIVGATDASGNTITPFQPAVPDVANLNRHDYNVQPKELSAYIQDKLEFKSIILNVGLRFDYFDPNSVVPVDPNDPCIYYPLKNEHLYANWVPMPSSFHGTLDQYIDSLKSNNIIREYTPDERRAFMQKKADTKMALSPRLGFSFPITDRGIMHFSYGHFVQMPQFQYIYTDPDFKVNTTSTVSSVVMGNANLDPQKTVMYEIGLQQQFSDVISVDATLFYRDVRGWVGTSSLINLMRSSTIETGTGYSQYVNRDYENVKGITLKIEKRFSDNYSFRADYTYQSAEGTYTNPNDEYNDIINNRAPVLALLPLGFDQKHTANVQFMYSISDWVFSLIGRYWTGLPYTPAPTYGGGLGFGVTSGITTNSERLPAQKTVDLTISKLVKLSSRVNIEIFLNVYNLLDQRDATSVYSDTGTPEYTTNSAVARTYDPLRVSTVEDFVNQPSWYTSPRQVQFGVSLGFN
jgi:16S rRNA G966 N2-methylase RsmD